MRCRAIPYEGKEPFLFLSYCHADEKIVYPIFEQMAVAGYRVWYDEGNNAGDDWANNIAQHLSSSTAVVAFITEKASESVSCNNELTFAVGHKKKVIPILMESFTLSGGMELMLSRVHFLKRLDFPTDDALIDKVGHTDGVDVCLDKSGEPKLRIVTDEQNGDEKNKAVDNGLEQELKEILGQKEKGTVENTDPPDKGIVEADKKPEEKKEVIEEMDVDDDKVVDDPYDPDDTPTVYTPRGSKKGKQEDDDDKTQKARNVDQIMLLLPSSGVSYITSELEVIIGRSKAKSHFVIEDHPTIGRTHASILHSDKKYYLKDLNSTNGTYYQGNEIKDGKVIELNGVDIFTLHNEPVIFVSGKVLVQTIATGRLAVVMSVKRTGIKALATGSLPLNRNHKWPDGTMRDSRVHRISHARLDMRYDGCYLVEEGPKAPNPNNGTFLNEQRLDISEACKLKHGDTIRLGDTELTYMLFEVKGAK